MEKLEPSYTADGKWNTTSTLANILIVPQKRKKKEHRFIVWPNNLILTDIQEKWNHMSTQKLVHELKSGNNPNIHQMMNRLKKYDAWIQWDIIQP